MGKRIKSARKVVPNWTREIVGLKDGWYQAITMDPETCGFEWAVGFVKIEDEAIVCALQAHDEDEPTYDLPDEEWVIRTPPVTVYTPDSGEYANLTACKHASEDMYHPMGDDGEEDENILICHNCMKEWHSNG